MTAPFTASNGWRVVPADAPHAPVLHMLDPQGGYHFLTGLDRRVIAALVEYAATIGITAAKATGRTDADRRPSDLEHVENLAQRLYRDSASEAAWGDLSVHERAPWRRKAWGVATDFVDPSGEKSA